MMLSLFFKLPRPLRFGAIGGLNTAIDFGLFFLLVTGIGIHYVPANIVSTSIALAASFYLNAKLTFGSTMTKQNATSFLVVTLGGLWVLQPIVIALSQPTIGQVLTSLDYTAVLFVAKIIATVASLLWNYFLYSQFVFRD